ncbi:DUF4440 domain-containing protein [Agrobacterium tumefaciens]|uniref:YybH family protein n=1 Tax=Agrobacterium tumefaciens TaxID=358 RepID=UPI0012B6D503|nr:nuclear transport factor 2 family protein [Agrobacterium tumefaciens]MQB07277.1 DUF4440 domain-containing protein [Agrobacterium tumefaciens]
MDKQTIQSFNEGFLELIHSKNVDAIVDFYTEDGLLLPPGMPVIRGQNDIRAFWNGFIDQIERFGLETLDIKLLAEDSIREVGRFTFRSADASQPLITGKYIVIWEKVGTIWKFAVDIWNTDK